MVSDEVRPKSDIRQLSRQLMTKVETQNTYAFIKSSEMANNFHIQLFQLSLKKIKIDGPSLNRKEQVVVVICFSLQTSNHPYRRYHLVIIYRQSNSVLVW